MQGLLSMAQVEGSLGTTSALPRHINEGGSQFKPDESAFELLALRGQNKKRHNSGLCMGMPRPDMKALFTDCDS